MAVEIELKAKLSDYILIKERLSVLGSYSHSYEKMDAYWFPLTPAAFGASGPFSGVRIRRERKQDEDNTSKEFILVTYKDKEISGGIEVNDEKEFFISDAAPFEELLGRIGLHKAIQKEKRGWAWTITLPGPPVLAELSLVEPLGWFLELEILALDNLGQTVEDSRKQLLSLLEKLEIPVGQIEPRPYMEMLQQQL
jgi:predicted adenylyl cyclase CyaB